MILKHLDKKFLISSLLVILIFLIDRFSKIYVIHLDKKYLVPEIFSSKYLNINLIWNDGIAFGLFSFEKDSLYNFLTIFIFIIILVIVFIINKSEGLKKYSLLMVVGGALGNFFDRVFYKAVPDFIDFHTENFHWFIFNVADIFISLGVFFMIFLEFTDNSTNKKNEFF